MAKKRFGYGDYFCTVCGERMEKDAAACPRCGQPYSESKYDGIRQLGAGGVGYSTHANDPAFKKYKTKTRRSMFLFLLIVSVGIAAFLLISGELDADAEGLRTLAIILAIIWAFDILWYISGSRKKKDWEGAVENKETHERRTRRDYDNGDYDYEYSQVYQVNFRTDRGRRKTLTSTDDSKWFDYYNDGERVRFIGSLHYYEKFDKSHDAVVPCAACGSFRDAREDYCGRCGVILLKGQPPVSAPPRSAPEPTTRTPGVKFCPNCGAKANGGAFCRECGAKL